MPPAQQVSDVEPPAPLVPPVLASQPLGVSFALRVQTCIWSAPMPVGLPSDAVPPRGLLQFDVLISPVVVSIVPTAGSVLSAGMPSAFHGRATSGCPIRAYWVHRTRLCGTIDRCRWNIPRPGSGTWSDLRPWWGLETTFFRFQEDSARLLTAVVCRR